MSRDLAVVLICLPTLPLAAGIAARAFGARAAGQLTTFAAMAATLVAAMAAALLVVHGPQTARWAPFGENAAFAGALRLDAVSAMMGLLVAFLGAVVLGFSRNYLAGEPGQSRFFSWMSLTLASVLTLVLSGHLLLLLASWVATSLCLHRLLLFYPERAGAVFAARKKFVFSRMGDACLLAAALVMHSHHGTFDLEAIFADVARGNTGGVAPGAVLLAGCAMLKSAQFPFHSWLPDTMETPTPVSAFMHAGIVNAGGFLVVRLAPIFAGAPFASGLLALAGAFTAAFGAIVMLAQPSVKRALAFSTIAQMGFMVLQCGLGAYALALLHIAAHSLYKAHTFLTSGSTIGAVPRAAVPLRTPALTVGVLAGSLMVALGATALHALAPAVVVHPGVFGVVLALALAYGVARTWSAGGGVRTTVRAFVAAAAIASLSLCLHAGTSALFNGLPTMQPPGALLGAVGAVFAGLFLFQALLWRANLHPAGRRFYVHALNGFYVGILCNRLLARLWPRQTLPARFVSPTAAVRPLQHALPRDSANT
jgi:NAD(P)H-quinone oxidoreductase subunit 5